MASKPGAVKQRAAQAASHAELEQPGEGSGSHSPVELYEHQVPDLQDVGVILIDQVGSISVPDPVIVDLAARATGACVSHFPEVVLHTARQNPALSQPVTRNSC